MAENVIGQKEHKIILINRKTISITGVLKVNSVNENCANLEIPNGTLQISGNDIKMKKLLVEDGVIEMDGDFESLKYGGARMKGNFFKRIFK